MATALAKDRFGRPIQVLGLGTSQDIAFSTGASTTGAVLARDCQAIRVVADQDCRIAVGASGSVSAAATGARLMAGVPETFRVPTELSTGIVVSIAVAARGVTTSGTLNVTEMI